MISITTVTPIYRGEKTLRSLVMALDEYRKSLEIPECPIRLVESIFVDDGSSDNSAQVLRELKREYPWIHVITLSRNFGQHPATIAGILHSSGDWVATLDEDLQHHPRFLNYLLKEAVNAQVDIVYANPIEAVHQSLWRDLASRGYKLILAQLTRNKFMPLFNSFRMVRGSIARAASAVSIDQTYFDVALGWFTTRIKGLKLPLVDIRYVETGKSSYSFWSLLSHARRLLQSSNVKFLRLGALIGLLTMMMGIVGIITTTVIKLKFPDLITVPGWASNIILTLFIGGLNAFLIGLVLENISVILQQSYGKPKFFEIDRSTDLIVSDWFKRFQE